MTKNNYRVKGRTLFYLYKTSYLSDVTLSINNRPYKLHSMIICENEFFNNIVVNKQQSITLKNIDNEEASRHYVEDLIEFLYNEGLNEKDYLLDCYKTFSQINFGVLRYQYDYILNLHHLSKQISCGKLEQICFNILQKLNSYIIEIEIIISSRNNNLFEINKKPYYIYFSQIMYLRYLDLGMKLDRNGLDCTLLYYITYHCNDIKIIEHVLDHSLETDLDINHYVNKYCNEDIKEEVIDYLRNKK